MVPAPHERLELGDYLHLVGKREDLENARLVIGEEVDASLSTRGTALQVVRAVVTNEQVLGKKIRDLNLKQKYDVVISRLNRAGVELVAGSNVTLQFGDILNLVGRPGGHRRGDGNRRQRPTKTAAGADAAGLYRHRPWGCCSAPFHCSCPASRRHCGWGWPAGRWWRR